MQIFVNVKINKQPDKTFRFFCIELVTELQCVQVLHIYNQFEC